ncbi:MAG: MMPL family transporter [Dactylosporangium sp.]|nr:MMPL family transporter [Dactylosporangium sp.]NNJ60953.1 MMPL family transporter [Dactylosporangium sp.]
MLGWWGTTVVRLRWGILAAAIVLAVGGGIWGTGVFGSLIDGGFEDPGSESALAAKRIITEVGRQDADLIVIYDSDTATVNDPVFRDAVTGTLARVRQRAEISTAVSFYDTGNPAMVSTDRHATYVVIMLSEAGSIDQYEAVRDDLGAPGLGHQLAGNATVSAEVTNRVSTDIARAEMYSMPILAVLLLIVFGSAVAAGLPLLVGGLAVLGAFVAIRVLTFVTDVSVFSINIITLIGMGLAIDYALFMVSRFREELAAGHSTAVAVQHSLATAGRTIAVSGTIVALALASLLLFPQAFLRSMGFGGMSAVLVAMITALTVLPALLAVLGPRVNAVRVRLPFRRPPADRAATGSQAWARLARAVMRRPVIVITGTLTLLVVLALPFSRAQFSGPDERVLPPSAASRAATERLVSDFPSNSGSAIRVLVSGTDQASAGAFAARIGDLDGVTAAAVTAARGDSFLIAVGCRDSSASGTARLLVSEIRDLPAPEGARVMVAGYSAELADLLHSLGTRLPWMGLIVAVSTFLLLLAAFGSLLLPLKAIVMSMVSIGASFGAVVWVFQDGHLAGPLGFTSTGDLEASQLILMLAIIFGLSTDYEVFLLSRVREEWLRTGDNVASVAGGLQRTGQIITSAALLLIVVIGGFAAGGISFIKMIGIGMIVAIVVDATIVRILLVPATMRLLGAANWWLPGPLARLHRRLAGPAGQA